MDLFLSKCPLFILPWATVLRTFSSALDGVARPDQPWYMTGGRPSRAVCADAAVRSSSCHHAARSQAGAASRGHHGRNNDSQFISSFLLPNWLHPSVSRAGLHGPANMCTRGN